MYHVIGTGSTAILLYIISYLFYCVGFYSLQFHRKFWNSILVAAFLVTILAGLFLALQNTYKWEISVAKSILKWHVEFGIGMAFTGIFHFLWHLSYFSKRLTNSDNFPEIKNQQNLTIGFVRTNLFIVGIVSTSVQLLLLRELMNITGGYELITGIFLGSWLMGSAIGAYISGRSELFNIRRINLVFSVSPVVSVFLLLFLSRLFLTTGETPSLLVSMIFTFLVLLPFCLVSGFTFTKLISIARSENNLIPGKSFSIETIGAILAGITVPILTAGVLNTYQLLLLIILLYASYVLLTFYIIIEKRKFILKVIILILAGGIIIFNPDIFFRQMLLPGIEVINTKDTPYGNLTEGNYKGEKSLYYNQRLLSYNQDVIEREENIHYPMLQSESPDKVIVVSGSLPTILPEILKYPVRKIIYVERDPELARSVMFTNDTNRAELIVSNTDAFRYIRRSKEPADVIILLIPPPSSLLLNRYYTTEFFLDAKKKLSGDGIFMCSPGPGDNYFNKSSLDLYSSVYNSLKNVFKNVMPVVGNKLYFIASDKVLSPSYCMLASEKNINNIYVNGDYLSDELIIKKSKEVNLLMDSEVRQNRSTFPVALFHFQSNLFSKNRDEKVTAIAIMIIAFALPFLGVKRRNMTMYFTASSLAGFEIILLLTLQQIIGNMYQLTGLIIAGVMAGLAIGSGLEMKKLNTLSLRTKGIFLLTFYIIAGLIYNYLPEFRFEFPAVVILIFSAFVPALLTGNIFSRLTIPEDKQTSVSGIYSADLAGSAFGFILISGITIPAFGIRVSTFILAALIFAGLLFGTIRNK